MPENVALGHPRAAHRRPRLSSSNTMNAPFRSRCAVLSRAQVTLSLTLALVAGAPPAQAQDGKAVLDLLVREGILTSAQAEKVGKDAAKTPAPADAKAKPAAEIRIAGDARVRYEVRTGELATGDHQERGRFRYRLRTALSTKLPNNWAFGVRLETSSSSRSTNVTMGDDGGPFAKNNDGLFVGQIFATWTPTPQWTFTAGRMPHPLVTTSLVWDGDINPEGLAERYKRRDGQNEFSVTLGQFVYGSSGNQNVYGGTAGAAGTKDLFLTAWQGGYKRYLEGTTTFFQIAPVLYLYHNTDQNANPAAFNRVFSPTNAAAVNNLVILEVPFEYALKAKSGVPLRAFADVAINFDGKQRAAKFGRADLDGENKAWQAGFQYGKAAKAGEWDARVFYQSIGAFSLDANLVDSDLFDSRTNLRGWAFGGNYALGSATQFSLTLASARRKNGSVIAPGSGDVGANNALDRYWLLQTDLNIKF